MVEAMVGGLRAARLLSRAFIPLRLRDALSFLTRTHVQDFNTKSATQKTGAPTRPLP